MMPRARVVNAAAILLFTGALKVSAQADTEKPSTTTLDNLKTPASPAFELLGVSPTAIARPATPRALATDLLSKSARGTVLPNNYALEFAPYWLAPRRTLTFEEYVAPSPSQSARQSFSVSFATSRPDTVSDTSSTRVALGIRVVPLAGHASARFRQLLASLDSIQRTRIPVIQKQADALDALDAIVTRRAVHDAALAAATAKNDAVAIAAANEAIRVDKDEADKARATEREAQATLKAKADSQRVLATAMGEADAERRGHFLSVAGGVSGVFPAGRVDGSRLGRIGVWGTYSYRMESPHLDVIGLLRFLRDVADANQNALETGARLLWMHNNLGISGEWVHRNAFTVGAPTSTTTGTQRTLTFASSNRAVGIAEYRAADALYVTMSFGQEFKQLGVDRRPLVAILGLQLLYGDKPAVKLPTKS